MPQPLFSGPLVKTPSTGRSPAEPPPNPFRRAPDRSLSTLACVRTTLAVIATSILACVPRAELDGLPPPCAAGWAEEDGVCVRNRLSRDASVPSDAGPRVDAGFDGSPTDASSTDAGPDSSDESDASEPLTLVLETLRDSQLSRFSGSFYSNGEADGVLYTGWWSPAPVWLVVSFDLSSLPDRPLRSAVLTGRVAGVVNAPPNVLVRTEDASEPAFPVSHEDAPDNGSPVSRPLRATSVRWSGPWTEGAVARSPDLTSIIEDWRTSHDGTLHVWMASEEAVQREVGFYDRDIRPDDALRLELVLD